MGGARQLEVEFLEAARGCGASLQKALAAPGLVSLCRDLAVKVAAGTWHPGLYTRFAVEEPKLREIFAPCFADRVVESWLTALLEPALEKALIDNSYANRKDTGPLAAALKAKSTCGDQGMSGAGRLTRVAARAHKLMDGPSRLSSVLFYRHPGESRDPCLSPSFRPGPFHPIIASYKSSQ